MHSIGKQCEQVDWISLVRNNDWWRAPVNTVIKFSGFIKCRKFVNKLNFKQTKQKISDASTDIRYRLREIIRGKIVDVDKVSAISELAATTTQQCVYNNGN
jgi:hypothetical protein